MAGAPAGHACNVGRGAAEWGPQREGGVPASVRPPAGHPEPPREPPGEPRQLPPLLSREVIRITFVGSNFRSSSIALSPHWQLMPDSVTDLLLGGSIASIIGDGGDRMGRALALLSYLP